MAINMVWGVLKPQERKIVLDGAYVLKIMDTSTTSCCNFLFLNHKLHCGVVGCHLPECSHEIQIPDNAVVIDLNDNNGCVN